MKNKNLLVPGNYVMVEGKAVKIMKVKNANTGNVELETGKYIVPEDAEIKTQAEVDAELAGSGTTNKNEDTVSKIVVGNFVMVAENKVAIVEVINAETGEVKLEGIDEPVIVTEELIIVAEIEKVSIIVVGAHIAIDGKAIEITEVVDATKGEVKIAGGDEIITIVETDILTTEQVEEMNKVELTWEEKFVLMVDEKDKLYNELMVKYTDLETRHNDLADSKLLLEKRVASLNPIQKAQAVIAEDSFLDGLI